MEVMVSWMRAARAAASTCMGAVWVGWLVGWVGGWLVENGFNACAQAQDMAGTFKGTKCFISHQLLAIRAASSAGTNGHNSTKCV
jgi:hypothetical protein